MGILLSILPLFLTYLALRAHQQLTPPSPKWRTIIFVAGVIASVLCAATTLCSWFALFPLVSDGHGGYSDGRNDLLYLLAIATPLITFVLASFGRGKSRLFLWGAAPIQLVIAYLAIQRNAV